MLKQNFTQFGYRAFRICLLLLLPVTSSADIWETENSWDENWEAAFSLWVRDNYRPDIFTSGPYRDIRHDCSDSVYYARLLFAYENSLPFVILDPDYSDENQERFNSFPLIDREGRPSPYDIVEKFISNEMDYFDHLEPRERLMRFIKFVGEITWTRSLMEDTYPVKLDRGWFKPGVVAVLPRAMVFSEGQFDILNHDSFGMDNLVASFTSGHAQLVTQVDETGVIHYLKSTMPAKVQALQPTTLNSFVPGPEGGSFRRWKQPQHYDRPDEELPGFGIEQYETNGVFEDVIQQRLSLKNETIDDKLKRLTREVCMQLKQRLPVVEKAWRHKQQMDRSCMDYQEFDLYSTPSRDGKIIKTVDYLQHTLSRDDANQTSLIKQLDTVCETLLLSDGSEVLASTFIDQLLQGNSYLSDPNQSPLIRWGKQLPSEDEQNCKQYY